MYVGHNNLFFVYRVAAEGITVFRNVNKLTGHDAFSFVKNSNYICDKGPNAFIKRGSNIYI